MVQHILKKRGFTLIEVLVVIGIIAILGSVVIFAASSARAKANDVARIQALNDLHGALMLYYIDHKKYPQVAPVCEHVNDDFDTSTPSNDDAPVCYTSGHSPSCAGTVNYPTCTGYRQKFTDTNTPSKYGCSGGGGNDTMTCGWGVNRGVSPYEIHTVNADGTCPLQGDTATKLSKIGISTGEYLGLTPNYSSPDAGTFGTAGDFQTSFVADKMDINSALLETLFAGGYLSRKTWDLPEGANDINTCRYVVRGEDNLDDGDGQPPWNGNVQNYLIFCNLETLANKEANDGGFNSSVYEIYSPGTPKLCVTGSVSS